MIDLRKKFLGFVEGERLFSRGEPILLAVSGGIDSMVMLNLFHQADFKFGIGHINFQLREKESYDDEEFVRNAALAIGVRYYTAHFPTDEYAKRNKISIQMAARELRYNWLEKVRKENGYHHIATAHHIDDSIETVFLNMIRGTGIYGLRGISLTNDKIVRPLSCFHKEELKEYANENKISYREDSSNSTVDYDRNKIRLEIIPAIEKDFPAFKKVFAENILKWKDAAVLYEESVKRIRKKLFQERGNEYWISLPELRRNPAYKTILFELLKDFDFNSDQVDLIADSFEGESGKTFLSPTYRILKDRKHLILSTFAAVSISEVLIQETDQHAEAGKLHLNFSEKDTKDFFIPKDSSICCLDKSKLNFPLVLRKWKKGDYFYPFGMKKKKKKVSDFLIDRKIPLSEKENIWVVESNKRIACIIGQRIDERFRISPSTEIAYVISPFV